jgi:eukaryotic-like serine/threonine-protein kinase
VLKEPDLEAVPPQIRRVLRRCLEKDPKKRLRDISSVEVLLEETQEPPPAPLPGPSRTHFGVVATAAALLGVAAGVLAFVHFREAPPSERLLRYTVAAPENSQVHSFAVSPDGRFVVISAVVSGKRHLWLRPLDALQAQPLAFTEDASYPFWSPDSRFIGFFAEGKLKKVAASGGPSQSLCDVPVFLGGSWNRDDMIVFSPAGAGNSIAIQRVSAAGGVPTDVTRTKGDYRHPWFLPDGRHFLYVARGSSPEKNGVYVSSLDGKENRRVLADVSSAVFAPPTVGTHIGHLLFIRESTLMARPFDARSAQTAGDVFPVAEAVSLTTNGTYAPVAASENGVLLFLTGGSVGAFNQLVWFDRTGKLLGPIGAPGAVFEPAISPDEKSVAFRRQAASGANLWVRDLNRGTEQRFTTDPSVNFSPSWSPKRDRIVFGSNRGGNANLYIKAANGSGQDELLFRTANLKVPTQWSRDGRFIVYQEGDNRRDIWVLPVESATSSAPADRKPIPFLRTEFDELFGQLSPDSHWMAYTSDKSGRREVYVRPFPPAEGEWSVSIAGGSQPRWRGDGRELFFKGADGKMMAVPVRAETPSGSGDKPSFDAGTPVALFDAAQMAYLGNDVLFEYDVTADGKRFLIDTTSTRGVASSPLTVVVNWTAGLKK